jgi:polysaccharide export outer membrane protein
MVTRRQSLIGLLGLGLTSCATGAIAPGDQSTGADRIVEEYRLGAGDRVRVIVFNEAALTGEFQVSGAGRISLPLIGDQEVEGLTVAQLQKLIEDRLRDGFLNEPRVAAEVLTYRPFYVLGEVRTPGTYPYTSGLTVLNAVATAGGFTYRADTKRVFIRRQGEAREEAYRLTTTTAVAPGDTIRIAERLF